MVVPTATTVRYHLLTPMLLNELQKQNKVITVQQQLMKSQQDRIAAQQEQITVQQKLSEAQQHQIADQQQQIDGLQQRLLRVESLLSQQLQATNQK